MRPDSPEDLLLDVPSGHDFACILHPFLGCHHSESVSKKLIKNCFLLCGMKLFFQNQGGISNLVLLSSPCHNWAKLWQAEVCRGYLHTGPMDQPALLGNVFKSGCARSRLTLLHKKQTTTVIMKFLDFELSGV